MPELPEVETIARKLRQGEGDAVKLPGRIFTGVDLLWPRTIAQPSAEEFTSRLPGQIIETVGRQGKFLVFVLSQDVMLIHLRMSGDLRVEKKEDPAGCLNQPERHDRVILYLDENYRLAFNDVRKFGRIWLVKDAKSITANLGPDPFDPLLTASVFYHRLCLSHRQIKPLLLDQGFLSGIGNIYADESLHRAGLHPLSISNSISADQSQKLLESIRFVLEEGIRRNGASIDWVYRGGDFQNFFQVYQRTGQPCFVCGTLIERIIVGQRGTHYCPYCQPRF
jgi:formamidopyrimidine-DNA glycosylase